MPAFCQFAVKTIPGTSRNAIVGWVGEELKIKVSAPAVDGRANEALCAFLAARLGLPRRAVSLLRGEKSRHKVVRADGLTKEEAVRRLQA